MKAKVKGERGFYFVEIGEDEEGSSCNQCGAPIMWAQTSKGKRMPLDNEPDSASDPGLNVWTSHYDTCEERREKAAPAHSDKQSSDLTGIMDMITALNRDIRELRGDVIDVKMRLAMVERAIPPAKMGAIPDDDDPKF